MEKKNFIPMQMAYSMETRAKLMSPKRLSF